MKHAVHPAIVLIVSAILGALAGACVKGEREEDGPTAEEIEDAQRGFCERAIACDRGYASMDECLEKVQSLYAYSEECAELYYARDTCIIPIPDCENWVQCDKERATAEGHECEIFGEPLTTSSTQQ